MALRLPRRARASLAAAIAFGAIAFGLPVEAAPNNNNSAKLRQAVTLEGVRAHQAAWQEIADEAGGNRFAGLEGHDKSAEYVIEQLEAAGYDPYVHEFIYPAFFENAPAELERLTPSSTSYVNGIEFRIMSFSGSGNVTAPVQEVDAFSGNSGCEAADFAGFAAGNIALMRRGSCTFRIKTTNAAAAGASAALIFNNVPGVINGTLGVGGLSSIPSLGLTQALGEELRSQAGSGLSMRVFASTGSEDLPTYNVLAELPGSTNPDNVVMVGAHLDSVTAGPGINDNGSGSAAILETAIQMAKVKPRNTVRFAWWSAEESGLIGSAQYVASLSAEELQKIALYLNFDMIGSPNFVRFIYDGDNSAFMPGVDGVQTGPAGSGAIEQLFFDYFESQGLESAPTPFNGRSDYGPFIAKGIPAGGLFTGAEGIKTAAQADIFGGIAGVAFDPCYHAACDTYDNNSDLGLDQMSDAVAHAVITYAQNTQAINAVKGKGNFKPGSSNGSNGTGQSGGGGLHDDHEHVAE